VLTSLVVPAKRQTPCVKRGESGPKRALNVPPIPAARTVQKLLPTAGVTVRVPTQGYLNYWSARP